MENIKYNLREYLLLRLWWRNNIDLMLKELGFCIYLEPFSQITPSNGQYIEPNELTDSSADVSMFEDTPEVEFQLVEGIWFWLYKHTTGSVKEKIGDYLLNYIEEDTLIFIINTMTFDKALKPRLMTIRNSSNTSGFQTFEMNDGKIEHLDKLSVLGTDFIFKELDEVSYNFKDRDYEYLILYHGLLIESIGGIDKIIGSISSSRLSINSPIEVEFSDFKRISIPKFERITEFKDLIKSNELIISLDDVFITSENIAETTSINCDEKVVSLMNFKTICKEILPNYCKHFIAY